MIDPTNPGGWPDAEAPGVPLNPEQDGVHWLRYQDGAYVEVTAFAWERDGWWHHGRHTHAREWRQWDYIAPVLTPAEIAAQVAAQVAAARAEVAALKDAADNMAEAMARIVQWAEAYPEDVFPPVDLKAARERLGDDALFSRLHAEWARHLTKGIGGIARAALKGPPA